MFQLSLSTSLTPLAMPGAGVSPVPAAAFTVALAGAASAIEGLQDIDTTATAPRQAPAETGKTLPITADTSDVLAWLDAGEAQPSGRPIVLGTLPVTPDASPPAQAAGSKPVEPANPNPIVTPDAPPKSAAAITFTIATPAVIAKTVKSDPTFPAPPAPPARDDSIAPSAAASGETPVTPVVADIRASAPVRPDKAQADRAHAKAPKHHDRPASRSEPDAAPIVLAANAPTIAVAPVPLPADRPAAAPASPEAPSSPVIAAPVSGRLSASRRPAYAALRPPAPTDAATFSVTPQADVALAPAAPLNDEVAPVSEQTPALLAEKIATPDIAHTEVVTLPIPDSVRQPVSGAQAVAPAPIAAPLRAAIPLAARNAAPVAPSPAPGSHVVASSAPSEAAPIVAHPFTPATATPTPVDSKVQAHASPSAATAIVRPEHRIAPTVRETATSPAPVATPAIANAPAISATPLSPEHPSMPVSAPVLVAAPSDAAPVAGPTLQTRQSAAIDAAAASPVAANATDPRAPVVAPAIAQTAPQSAGMMFGIALGAPLLDPRPLDRSSPRDEALQALTSLAATGSATPIAAAGGAQQGALDMHRDDWPQAMIDRIEALRDAADATSTRITLVPEALGKVDLSIRHDGDAVHVHFAAEAAQTRAILAEAQPRLAELAQARGLKLGQATVDAGTGGQGQRQQPAATPTQPQRPTSAFTRAAADDSAAVTDSNRLA